jgi:predicted secreted protein
VESAEHALVQSDFGGSREIRLGDQVSIELLEYATAGYRWQVSCEPPDAAGHIDSEYMPPESDAGGAAGLRRFRLRPPRAGRVHLAFRMVSPFRKSEPPAASGTIELHVRT